jgi:hypothetical protein
LSSAARFLDDLRLVGGISKPSVETLLEECVGVVAYFGPCFLLTMPPSGFRRGHGSSAFEPSGRIDLFLCSRVSLFELPFVGFVSLRE